MNRIIHQVFIKFKPTMDLSDIPIFSSETQLTQDYCKSNNITYKLWREPEIDRLLLKYPQYRKLYDNFKQPIQRCDFIRYLILFIHGGWYIDCDVYPLQDLTPLENNNQCFTTWHIDHKRLPYNAVFGSTDRNPLFLDIIEDVERRTYLKQSQKIYETWKGRLVFQTTGHSMLKNHIPKEDIHDLLTVFNEKKKIDCSSDNPYFHDSNISSWWGK